MRADAWQALFSGGALLVGIVAAAGGLIQLSRYISEKKDENRPFVLVDFLMRDGLLCVYAQNIGKTSAIDVEIKFHPDLQSSTSSMQEKARNALSRPITYMAPDRKMSWIIDSWVMAFQRYGDVPHKYEVEVSYFGVPHGHTLFRKIPKKPEKFTDPTRILDLKQYEGTTIRDTETP